ncbi:MAG: Calx-beta domain-containing protein, partial [Planctomycetota bacterium]|nr:Calx-beta domain-containing protein [Planctomycetota bacterium]
EQTIQVLAQTSAATMGRQAQGDLTPQASTDFLTNSQVLTFNSMTTMQNFDVTIVDDAALPINEPTEFFDVNLSAQGQLPRGVTIGLAKETGTIVDNDIVTVTIAPPANAIIEGSDGGSTVANFVVTLTGRTTQTIVVDYMAETGGANPGTPNLDYVPATNTLTLQADTVNATRTVNAPVNIVADTINETDQTFQVRIALSGILSGVQLPTPVALGTIIDDDAVTIRVVNNNPVVPSVDQVAEANGPAQFQVIVVGTDPVNPATFTEQTFSVDFTTADGTAVQPGDYTATTQTVTVSGLATNAVVLGTTAVAVPVISDTINETNENFTSAIGNLMGSTNLVTIDGAAAGTTVTIIDDDILVVNLRTRDVLTNEGADSFFELFVDTNNPANTATGTEQSFTFSFVTMQTTPIQAADNVDFMAINAPVTVTTNAINPFVLEQTLGTQTVSTIDEQAGQQINEPNEDFLGVASNLMNANNVQFTGQAVSVTTNQTILDNDAIVFNITAGAPVTELDAGGAPLNVTFNVGITGGSDLTAQTFNVPVQIGLMGDTAVAGADYDAAAATITPDLMFNGAPDVVPTNVAIVVPILFDDINEATESFRVALGTPTNMPVNVSIGNMPTATQVILDDDVIVFDLAISQASASEAVTNRTFDLVLNAGTMATATAQAFNVDLTPLSGVGANPAMAPGDFSATPDTEMFDGTTNPDTIAGRQLSVTVIDDGLNEQDEDFLAMISLPMAVNGVSINAAANTATGIILDNDDIVLNYAAGTNNQTIQERGNDGAQMANYAFNFSGATMSQQSIVVSVTAVAGITPPSATAPAGVAGNDYQFIDPAGAGQNVTDAIDDISGDENPESYRLTTAVTGRGVSVATADQNLDGNVRDVPLLNLNGAGILAVTPFGASFNTSTTPLRIAPNALVVNNGQDTSAALLTVDLMGSNTLPGDEISVLPGNLILVSGSDIFFDGSPIATTVTNPATVTTAGGSAQLQLAMLNNISQAATQALIRQIGFRDNNAGGGGRSVTATFTFNTGGGQATEARDARVTINGAFNFSRLIVGSGNAAQGGTGSVPVSLSAIAGDAPVGAQMTITYPTDGGNISASSVTIDPAIGTDHIVSAFNVSTPGVVTFQIISGSNTVLPSTRIANINFSNAAGTTLAANPLQVTAATLADAAAAPIPVVGVDGTLNIVPVIVLTGGTVTGDVSTTVALPVDITSPMGSTPVAIQVDILFNAGNIALNAAPTVGVDIIAGASATNAGAIIGVSNIAGGIRVVVASLSNQTLETGRLFDINFQINAGAGGTSNTVTLTNVVVSDSNLNTLPNQPINGTVNVN